MQKHRGCERRNESPYFFIGKSYKVDSLFMPAMHFITGFISLFLSVLEFAIAQEFSPEMVFVQGGSFKMGWNLGCEDERPVHEVVLNDFFIGKYEVTQTEWKMIMDQDTNKNYFEGCRLCPVERVSWYNVQEFIQKLNKKTSMNYRLPTEAEWEYAARGGSASKGYRYSGSNTDISVAWKVGASDQKTHPVGLKKPNELGIYDMSGNVFEWCSDWYSSTWYLVSPKSNPKGADAGDFRVIRGGSWFYDNSGLRISDRGSANPAYRYGYIGFRLCHSATAGNRIILIP